MVNSSWPMWQVKRRKKKKEKRKENCQHAPKQSKKQTSLSFFFTKVTYVNLIYIAEGTFKADSL